MQVRCSRYTVTSPRISRPERALVLADLHQQTRDGMLARWERLSPTLVLIPGDWLESDVKRTVGRERTLALLRALTERYPVYYSLGNHETGARGSCPPLAAGDIPRGWSARTRELCEQLEALGVHVLIDRCETHGSLCIGGLSAAGGDCVCSALLHQMAAQDGFRLLLCHHPEYYDTYVREHGLDLTVSGHAHGGQWCLFGRGLYAPGQGLLPRYTAGFYDNEHLLVSRGLAGRFPVPRLFNPREEIVLELLPRD